MKGSDTFLPFLQPMGLCSSPIGSYAKRGVLFMIIRPMTFFSSALYSRKTCYVSLPDSYDRSAEAYPVIYLLHGMHGAETDWIYKGSVLETAGALIGQGKLRDTILVMPSDGGYDTGTFYADWYDGSGYFEQYMMYDLIPYVEKTFRTQKTRESRMIAGTSMGGYGAFMLSLRHPDVFGAAASMSGAVGSMSEMRAFMSERIMGPLESPHAQKYNLQLLAEQRIHEHVFPALYFDCGTEDHYLYEGNIWFKKQLEKINYPFTFNAFPGGHDWGYWKIHLKDVLTFLGEHLDTWNKSMSAH